MFSIILPMLCHVSHTVSLSYLWLNQEDRISRSDSARAFTIWMDFSVIPGRVQTERFIPVEWFREKNTFRGISFSRFSRNFLYHLSNLLPAAVLRRKNAKDLKDGVRFPKRLSIQCVSLSVLVLSFTCMIRDSSVLLSYIEGKHYGCWLLIFLTKYGCCSNQTDETVVFLSQKIILHDRKFSRHVSCWYVPRPGRPTGIRNFQSNNTVNLFRFLSGKKSAVPFV